jgi:hypothetical protein
MQDTFGAERLSPDLQNFRSTLAKYFTDLIPMMNLDMFRQLFSKLQREMDKANDDTMEAAVVMTISKPSWESLHPPLMTRGLLGTTTIKA